jgi:hypothetical protein
VSRFSLRTRPNVRVIDALTMWPRAGGGGVTPTDPPPDPSDLTDLRLWLDATDAATITQTAGNVAGMVSKDPNARAFTKEGTTLTTGSTSFNGLNTLNASAANLIYNGVAADWKFLHDGTKHTIWAVVKFGNSSGSSFWGLLGTNGTTSAAHGASVYFDSTDRIQHQVGNNSGSVFPVNHSSGNGFFVANEYALLEVVVDPTNATAADRSAIRRNATSVAKNNASTASVSSSDPTRVLQVMTAGNNAGRLTGQFGELVIAVDPTPEEVAFVRDHFFTKWALPTLVGVAVTSGPILVSEDNGRHYAFPGLALAADGDLVVAYRDSVAHDIRTGTNRGITKVKRSSNGGTTWGSATTAYDHGSLDARDVGLTKLADNTLIMSLFTAGGSPSYVSRVVLSSDDGDTWGSAIETTNSLTWAAVSAPVVELAGGNLVLPIYGPQSGDSRESAVLVRSTDGGATWGSEIVIADGGVGSERWTEPVVILLSNDDLLCFIREEVGKNIYTTRSTDDGATWSTPVFAFAGTGRPAALQLASGVIVVVYRKPGALGSMDALLRSSDDGGATWTNPETIAAPSEAMSYAQMVETSAGVVKMAMALEDSSSVSDVYAYTLEE